MVYCFEALEYVNEKVLRLKMQLQLTMCNHAPEDQRVSYKLCNNNVWVIAISSGSDRRHFSGRGREI